MSDLLEKVLHAHGGLENWRRVDHIDFLLTLRGAALGLKKQPHGLRAAMVKVDTKRQRTAITPFPAPGSRGIYEEGTVRIETDSGVEISKLDEPRKTFRGYDRQSPWNELQFLYFIGYALTNYLTMPFLLASDGVCCEEVAPHEEHGERWRVLKVTFPDNIEVHCKIRRSLTPNNISRNTRCCCARAPVTPRLTCSTISAPTAPSSRMPRTS
jgi:hypothetical protein